MVPDDINTQEEYAAAMARIEKIFFAKPGTSNGDELEFLLRRVEAYEDVAFSIDPPTDD